jgi:hypothetical protein
MVFVGVGLFAVVSAVVIFFLSVDSSSQTLLFGILFLIWGLLLMRASTLKSDSSQGSAKEISVSPSRFPDFFTPPWRCGDVMATFLYKVLPSTWLRQRRRGTWT